jgi:hypothetical protein
MAVDATIETTETRRQPLALAERTDPEVVIEETSPGERDRQPGAEDAVLAARRAAEAADARARESETRRQQAERERDEARSTAGRAVVDERVASVDSQLESAKAAKDSAKARLRAAREASNYEEEEAALEALTEAQASIQNLSRDKAYLASEQKRPERQQPQRTDDVPDSEKQWVQSHPLFQTDHAYKAKVIGAVNEALALGMARGSPAYINHVNAEMAKLYGPGHGVAETHGRKANGGRTEQGSEREPTRQRLSQAMPRDAATSDEFSGGSNGRRYADTPYGRVEMTTGSDGKPMIKMPTRVKEEWSEAASWSGKKPDGSPKMSLAEYAMEQIAIAEEQRAGLSGGLSFDDERQVMR